MEEIGAGIQLSPNATRLLDRLGVLDRLRPVTVQPEAVVLRSAATMVEISRVPLGAAAEHRWGGPYLTAHRADLQAALLTEADHDDAISIHFASLAQDFAVDPPSLTVERQNGRTNVEAELVIAADGVWSTIRALGGLKGESRFVGQLAWRRTITRAQAEAIDPRLALPVVTAFLHPGFHLVSYPIKAGSEVNLVAITPYRHEIGAQWVVNPNPEALRDGMRGTSPILINLVGDGGDWLAWPLYVADLDGAWIDHGGMALIGDAAHAMTPFAAQGAAMAIEDAWTLAEAASQPNLTMDAALTEWNVARRRRVLRVARRGAFNEFAWHARGRIATARDMVLKMRGPQKLAADLDWLYGAT